MCPSRKKWCSGDFHLPSCQPKFLAHFLSTSYYFTTGKFPLDNQPPTFDSLEVEVKWEIALVAAKTVGQVSDSFLKRWIICQKQTTVHLIFTGIIYGLL